MLGKVAVDRGLQIDDRVEAAAADALTGECGEEVLDRVQPRCRGRSEVKAPARVPLQPSPYLRVLVRRIVVDDRLNAFVGWHLAIDGIEEANELLVPMALPPTA